MWSTSSDSQALQETKKNFRESLVKGWFLHPLNWVQRLQSKLKHRLIKTTHFAFPDFAKGQKHRSSQTSCSGKKGYTHKAIPSRLPLHWPPHHTCTKCPLLLLKITAHSVHFFIQEKFSDTDWCLLNTFYVSGSVLRVAYALFHRKIHIIPILQMRNQS